MPLDVVQGSPPVSPNEGDVWVNTRNGRRYVWTPNSTGGGAWVHTPPVGAPPPSPIPLDAPVITNPVPKITMSNVPPLTPVAGDLWFDTVRGFLFVFYNDGNTTQWVVANPGRGGNEGPAGLPGTPSGPAGGDLDGFYPDPIIMDSVVLTGAPTAPTPTANSNNQMLVTTNYIHDALAALPSVPTALPPNGPAGGDLTGGYPNPTIKSSVTLTGNPTTTTPTTADNTTKIPTTAWVKSQGYALNTSIPVTLPPSGPAGGALAGTYPNPGLAVPYPTTLPPNGPAGGDLQGTYPNPTLRSGVIPAPPTTLPPNGPAGGALAGTYPNPSLAVPYPTTLPPNGPAGGALSGTYPNPGLATPYPTTLPPSGTAGGDLSGSYPNPTIKPSVTNGQVMTTVAGVAAWAAGGGGGASVTVSDTAPGSPTSGALWWNSTLGVMFIWYTDPDTSQWVPVTPTVSGVGSFLPLGGGTLTGGLIGTTAVFSGNVQVDRLGVGGSTNPSAKVAVTDNTVQTGFNYLAAFTQWNSAAGATNTGLFIEQNATNVINLEVANQAGAKGTLNLQPFGGSVTTNGLNVGYLEIPQQAQTGSYTAVLADSGKHLYHAVAAAAATYTIPANASVPYAIGTTLSFVNDSANAVTIAITTDTLVLSPGTTTGSRTLATGGVATAIKVTATRWIINGTGLT